MPHGNKRGRILWALQWIGLFILCAVIVPWTASAEDRTAASCSHSDVNNAIADAISTNGGTVTIPACPESDWGDEKITIDTDTPLKIIGAGIDATNLACSANAMFIIRGGGLVEIGGFSVDLKGAGNVVVSLNAPEKTTDTWVHDIKALNSDSSPFKICHSANAKTVLSQLDIRHSDTYGIYVYGPAYLQDRTHPETDWGDDITGVCVIEDSYFFQNGGHVISGFTGSRVIVRYNTFDDMLDTGLDGHAWGYGQSCGLSDTDPRYHANNWGAYQWEIYNNLWANTSAQYCMRVRSGTAMVTDNVCDAAETVRLVIESKFNSGYDPDEVTGTDANIYTCIEPHIAAMDNRPVSGANWQTYWKQAGTSGSTWTSGESYYPFFSSQSDCRFSADIFKDFWDVIQGDTDIYGPDGKLIKAPCAYNMPHQWWIWNNTSSGTLFNKEDEPGCITEDATYWLRAPQTGDPVESYTKGACPDPLTELTGTCDDGAGKAYYNVGGSTSQPDPGPGNGSSDDDGFCFIRTILSDRLVPVVKPTDKTR